MHALDGIRIVDFTQMMLGPFATQFLGDMGADVIKVERPVLGEWERGLKATGQLLDGDSPFFLAMNRNKRSLSLNLKSDEAKAIVRKLVAEADVVTENFRPGVMDKLGLGYDDLRQINPKLIYASGSGYGPSGPYVSRPGQDLLIQALSGMLAQNGPGDRPPVPVACSIIDASTALTMALGIMFALFHRERTGEGQRVDVSLLNTALALQCQELLAHANLPRKAERSTAGIGAPWLSAPFGVYGTTDGSVAISINALDQVADALDLPALNDYADEERALEERDAVHRILTEAVAERTTTDVVEALLAKDLWCAEVRDFDQVIADPQVLHNRMMVDVPHPTRGSIKMTGIPIDLSATPGTIRLSAPKVGEHTDAILGEIGYAAADCERLRAAGVV